MSSFVGTGTDLGYGHAHCSRCFFLGHETAHPDLSCTEVGCPGGHPDAPLITGQWTQVCANAEHDVCSGHVGSVRWLCTCRCHDAAPLYPWPLQ